MPVKFFCPRAIGELLRNDLTPYYDTLHFSPQKTKKRPVYCDHYLALLIADLPEDQKYLGSNCLMVRWRCKARHRDTE